MPKIKLIVDGGKANAGPPLGPALAPLKVNIGAIVEAINQKTENFAGMQVPVDVTVDPSTKAFEIHVGMPSTSALIKKELGIKKASGNVKETIAGNLTLEQAKKIAETKIGAVNARSTKKAMNEIIGTCKALGVTVEGENPSKIIKELNLGRHDSFFGGRDSVATKEELEAEARAKEKEAERLAFNEQKAKIQAEADARKAAEAASIEAAKPEQKPAEAKK